MFSVVHDSTGAEVGTITTAADGTGSLGGLLRDAYTVRETTPPEGYMAAADVHVSADDPNNDAKTATVTADDGWTCSFDGLAKYDASDGHEIVYSVQEIDVAAGYMITITGGAASGFTVTNSKEEVPGTPGEPQETPGNPPDNPGDPQGGPGNPQDKQDAASSSAPKTGDDATVPAALPIAVLAACAAGAGVTICFRMTNHGASSSTISPCATISS